MVSSLLFLYATRKKSTFMRCVWSISLHILAGSAFQTKQLCLLLSIQFSVIRASIVCSLLVQFSRFHSQRACTVGLSFLRLIPIVPSFAPPLHNSPFAYPHGTSALISTAPFQPVSGGAQQKGCTIPHFTRTYSRHRCHRAESCSSSWPPLPVGPALWPSVPH